MIFGTLDGFPAIEENFSVRADRGENVVSNDFYINLLKYSSFDEYYFVRRRPLDEQQNKIILNFPDKKIKIVSLQEIGRLIKTAQFNIFHCNNHLLHPLCRLRMHTAKIFPVTGATHSIDNNIYSSLLPLLLNKTLQPFDDIICAGSNVKKVIENVISYISKGFSEGHQLHIKNNLRLKVIPHGVDTEIFRPREKFELRKKLNLPDDKLILLSLARFSFCYKMDLFPLLNVFKEISKENKEAFLVLVGAGSHCRPYIPAIKQFINENDLQDKILISENFNESLKPSLYAASDIFISLSDSINESFGVNILEAMASGLPVVVSDWNGYKETVVHNKTGFKVPTYWEIFKDKIPLLQQLLVPTHGFNTEPFVMGSQTLCIDQKETVNYLQLILNDTQLRKKMGEKARKRVLDMYDWKKIIPQYEAYWKQLYGESRNYKMPLGKMLFEFDFFGPYSHYPTSSETITASTKFRGTEQSIPTHLESFIVNHFCVPIRGLLDVQLIQYILYKAKDWASFEEIASDISQTYPEKDEEDIKFNIMWMLKYNLLIFKQQNSTHLS